MSQFLLESLGRQTRPLPVRHCGWQHLVWVVSVGHEVIKVQYSKFVQPGTVKLFRGGYSPCRIQKPNGRYVVKLNSTPQRTISNVQRIPDQRALQGTSFANARCIWWLERQYLLPSKSPKRIRNYSTKKDGSRNENCRSQDHWYVCSICNSQSVMWNNFMVGRMLSPPSYDDPRNQVRNGQSFGVETVMDGGNDGVETVRNCNSSIRSCSYDETDQESSMASRKSKGGLDNLTNKSSVLEFCPVINGSRVCLPYKREHLQKQIRAKAPGSLRRHAIIETLQELGIKVFVIDSNSTTSTSDIVMHIQRVVKYVSRENCIEPSTGPLGFQRCLLYQDQQGRLFNLTLPSHTVGPAETYKNYLESFSGLQAMIAATVLCRSLACISAGMFLEKIVSAVDRISLTHQCFEFSRQYFVTSSLFVANIRSGID